MSASSSRVSAFFMMPGSRAAAHSSVDARSLANAVSGESRASGLSEAVDVGGSVAVEDLAENTARLQSARIADVVIGQRLVGEAHAVAVHGHERLASHNSAERWCRGR